MSKIRGLIEEELGNVPLQSMISHEELAQQIEQSIKAEIMGLNRYEDGYTDDMYECEDGDYVKQSDLENLFKESE